MIIIYRIYWLFCGHWFVSLLVLFSLSLSLSGSDRQSSSDAVERASVSLQCYSSERCDQRSPRPPAAPEENLLEIQTQPRGTVHERESEETVFGIRREDTQEVMSQAPGYDSKGRTPPQYLMIRYQSVFT